MLHSLGHFSREHLGNQEEKEIKIITGDSERKQDLQVSRSFSLAYLALFCASCKAREVVVVVWLLSGV